MSSFKTYLLVILFVLSTFTVSNLGSIQESLHDLLEDYGLPKGIFPTNVKFFSLDEDNFLEVQLETPCLTKYESVVYFERVVRATLSEGKLWGMKGLSNKELFIWFPVKGIIANYPDPGVVMIDITMANKTLSLSIFEKPPTCQPHGEISSQVSSKLKKGGTKDVEFGFSDSKEDAFIF